MNDMRPRSSRPLSGTNTTKVSPSRQNPTSSADLPKITLDNDTPSSFSSLPTSPGRANKKWKWIIVGIVLALIAIVAAIFIWYRHELTPVNPSDTATKQVTIVSGSSPSQIGASLEEQDLIRNGQVFDIYVRVKGLHGLLQAGSYQLSPSNSVEEIVSFITGGQKQDDLVITFYPGSTLTDTSNAPLAEKRDVTSVLLRAGYDESEIKSALEKQYDHPIFATKPKQADLEGYVYGETYHFDQDATVEDILQRTFDEFYAAIQQNDLIAKLKEKGFSLYEGITLASIIQREEQAYEDQRRAAQVFLLRLERDMNLGSDPTYQYGARKLGVPATTDVDSPYNTRIIVGLPPGPIANPGITALLAIVNPAEGDFLYFINGDDNTMRMARTLAEHEQNVKDFCQIKCYSY